MSFRLLRLPTASREQQEQQQQQTSRVEARPGRRHKKLRTSWARLSPRKLLLSSRSDSLTDIPRIVGRKSFSPTSHKMAVDNVTLRWIQDQCPTDLIPKILSFAGPHAVSALNRTCRSWNKMVQTEAVWRTLCEDQYKWMEGDPIPSSWREYYRHNPCVPVDYTSIHRALAVASDHDEDTKHAPSNTCPVVLEQRRSIRILLKPGQYVLRKALNIHAIGSAQVSIETLPTHQGGFVYHEDDHTLVTEATSSAFGRRASNLRNILSCRYTNTVLEDVHVMEEDDHVFAPQQQETPMMQESAPEQIPIPSRATLVLKTKRQNEPIIRVRQGHLRIQNVQLLHNCHGADIWNGNAAIQVQPPLGPDDHPVQVIPRPAISLEGVEVISKSGRGIVNIDGGSAYIKNCFIHDCAATGIYVGGLGTHAVISETDVVSNGNGNRHRRGIARGHSGIYLEQGTASIQDCNISRNSLTGISAVSPDNAILHLRESDLVANGTVQLELPPNGSIARRRSVAVDNVLATQGIARSRSSLASDDATGMEQG